MMFSTPRYLLMMFATLFSHYALADDKLEIEDAWIAEAPPVSKVMAAYLEIENETRQDRQAIRISCDGFERAEFHRTIDRDGMASMEHQKSLQIPAGSELELKPGGYHIMLFNPARRMPAGDKTGCSMEFDDGTTIRFEPEVRKAAAAEDHSHHDHH